MNNPAGGTVHVTDSKVTGPALTIYLLWTVTGTGVYLIDTTR